MRTECCDQVELDLLPRKWVVAKFDGGQLTSDAGLALVAELDRRRGLTRRLAECLVDRRDRSKIELTQLDLLRQRIYGIVAGYEDGIDHNTLRADPMLKIAAGRAPLSDRDLAHSRRSRCRPESLRFVGTLGLPRSSPPSCAPRCRAGSTRGARPMPP